MVARALRYLGALVLIAAGHFRSCRRMRQRSLRQGGMVALAYTSLLLFVAYHLVMYGPESSATEDEPTTE